MPNPPLAVWIPILMNVVALLQCVFAATSFAEATVVKKNAKSAKKLKTSDYAQQSFPKSRCFWYNTHCQKRERI